MKTRRERMRTCVAIRSFAAGIIVVMILLSMPLLTMACDFCNKKFYEELLSSRKNSLIAKELLASIASQGGFGTGGGSIGGVAGKAGLADGEKKEFVEIINRDNRLPIPATSYVP